MMYQLVLQFRGEALAKYRAVDDVSARLTGALGTSMILDGEDVGEHGANVFLYVESPAEDFGRAVGIFDDPRGTPGFAAGYRQVASNSFHALWPAGAEFRLR